MKWLKYPIIILLSVVTKKTIINFFGSTYVIAGNVVRKIK